MKHRLQKRPYRVHLALYSGFNFWPAMTLYGMNLRLPNQFYPTANEWQTDPQASLQRHQHRVASYQYEPTRFPAHQKVHVNKRLLTCSHVMMSNDHKKHSLDAPWIGPWKVLRRGPKTYTIDWKGKAYTVSIDRLQPAYMLSDFNQSYHDVSRSASPNNHTRLSAAQMPHVSPLFLLRAMQFVTHLR